MYKIKAKYDFNNMVKQKQKNVKTLLSQIYF